MLLRVLIADKDREVRARLTRLLRSADVDVGLAGDLKTLSDRLPHEDADIVLVRRRLLPEQPETLLQRIQQQPSRPETVVLADHETHEERARLVAAGCLAVLPLRLDDAQLQEALHTLFQRRREQILQRLGATRADKPYRLADFASASPSMQRFIDIVRRVVSTDSPLLILGETGVGKERLARAISAESPRHGGPFIAVNCAALPEHLLESELFGHQEGAFTGATRMRRGYFELAHRGTLFLDEVGELPTHLQAKLLRVLEDHQVLRVGAERPIEIDVRVMAAANRDIDGEMQAGRFRADLYYRLAVVNLTIPPLRERCEDIPQLARGYLEQFRRQFGRPVRGITNEALAALVRHDWPGNVRELINVIERSVLICPGERVTLADLPRAITGAAQTPRRGAGGDGGGASGLASPARWLEQPLSKARRACMSEFEKSYLLHWLEQTRGRVGETARRAGVNERTLYDLMKKHGLRKETFRPPPRA
jgi:two-component system response regulator AtoC